MACFKITYRFPFPRRAYANPVLLTDLAMNAVFIIRDECIKQTRIQRWPQNRYDFVTRNQIALKQVWSERINRKNEMNNDQATLGVLTLKT